MSAMRIEYSRTGRQFFFVTLGVAERRPALSRLIDEKSRPALTELGEIVRAALRAIHRVWSAVAVSDYVIMPDHIHYLLIVNYDCDKSIGPLFIAHRLADAVETAVALGLDRTGARAPAPLNAPAAAQSAVYDIEQPDADAHEKQQSEEQVAKMVELFKTAIDDANRRAAVGSLKVESGLRFGEAAGGAGAV